MEYLNKKFNQASYNNVNTNHPLINNSQEYLVYKKYISIHSEDRDPIKYPFAGSFEIELPEDYLNVAKMSLYSWTFPSNYDVFSPSVGNVTMTFQINNPYNPNENSLSDPLQSAIFEALFKNMTNDYTIVIESGFYNPTQMTTELTNKFNHSVTNYIVTYFENNGYELLIPPFLISGGYQQFVIVYNNVGQNIWFGNRSSGFILTNSTAYVLSNATTTILNCAPNDTNIPDYSSWGLPSNLGLLRCDTESTSISNINLVRFYYGDVFPGDNGFWLTPDPSLPNAQVSYITAVNKINLMGNAVFYMELSGYNCIDETSPYNLSKFTLHTNQTNSIVNAAFAKIDVPCTPLSQWFDRNHMPYKFFYPPAERIRKLSVRLRYHNGALVDFGVFNYSFMLEFELLLPQINRSYIKL